MTTRLRPNRAGLVLIAAGLLLGLVPVSYAQTVCDTDPNAVDFQATVDPDALNELFARLGTIDVRPPNSAVTLGGLCVDHRIPITLDVLNLPVGTSPFTVTPSPGRVQVVLDVPGPFALSVDGGNYNSVNCDSICVVEIPYVGTIFNGCTVEEALARPVFSLFNVGASWDDIRATQVADTCVLGDCKAVHPVRSTQVSLFGFDIDATGFGSCQICLDFPEPFDFLDACLNPCDGLDPLITSLVRPLVEDAVEGAFVNRQGEGVLVKVFSRQIVKDGCADIPEVRECKENLPVADSAGLIRGPRDHGANGILYSLPLMVAVGLTVRFRRRVAPGTTAQ